MLSFWKSEPQYAYKRYGYKKICTNKKYKKANRKIVNLQFRFNDNLSYLRRRSKFTLLQFHFGPGTRVKIGNKTERKNGMCHQNCNTIMNICIVYVIGKHWIIHELKAQSAWLCYMYLRRLFKGLQNFYKITRR